MHLPHVPNAVLVLNTPAAADAAALGCEISGLPGIVSVTAYPERGQLLVRYQPAAILPEEIRACVWPDSEPALSGSLLAAWPRVAEVLPIAASLL